MVTFEPLFLTHFMKLRTILLVVMAASVAINNGCKDKEDGVDKDNTSTGKITDREKAYLYDVVWYSQDAGGGLDLEFLSDGTYRQAKSLEGTWVWLNNGDTMSIVDYTNKKFKYVFDEVTESSMKYRTDLGGNDFQKQYTYSTTK